MGLESGSWINDLVVTNPAATDFKSEGDDHLRLIKTVLKNTLPNMGGVFGRTVTKASGGTLTPADTTTHQRLTGAGTVSFNAAATLGNGWWCSINNDHSGSITLDPNGAETIDGSGTYSLQAGNSLFVYCDGSALYTVGEHDVNLIPISDSLSIVKGSADGTKRLRIDADAEVTTGNTRVWTMQDKNITVAGIDDIVHLWAQQGLTGENNGVTPASQFDFDVNFVKLINPTTYQPLMVKYTGGAITNNITTTGPAANGRDQSAAFTVPGWIHFYWIYNGTTLATLSSADPPETGPTLPSGYTHWAYIGAIYATTGPTLRVVEFNGDRVSYEARQQMVSGTAGSFSAVSVSAYVPPNAHSFNLHFRAEGLLDGNANWQHYGQTSIDGSNVFSEFGAKYESTFSQQAEWRQGENEHPNIGQQFYYRQVSIIGSSHSTVIQLTSYRVPNGSL